MGSTITKNGQKLGKYRARYFRRRAWPGCSPNEEIELQAVSDFQAQKIAAGIAKKNNWYLISVGRI